MKDGELLIKKNKNIQNIKYFDIQFAILYELFWEKSLNDKINVNIYFIHNEIK